jgi:thymidylate synthase
MGDPNLDTSAVWIKLLTELLDTHKDESSIVTPVSHGAAFGGGGSVELLAYKTTVNMADPVVKIKHRNLSYLFMATEAAVILSGDNRLAAYGVHTKNMARFSEDGVTLSGAYGPPFVEQAPWAAKRLATDRSTRQAVATIWRPRPGQDVRDVPCTVAVQWFIRGCELHSVVYMRSSDAWMGWPYDVFTFSAMGAYMLLLLKSAYGIDLSLGRLGLVAGSQHLYVQNFGGAAECVYDPIRVDVRPCFWPDVNLFRSPDELIKHLREMAEVKQVA